MNKQEFKKRIEDLPYTEGPIADTITVNRNWILESIEQLDEPEKVKIPQMVAEWLKKCKTFKSFAVSLSFALQPSVWEANSLSDECIEWLTDTENQDLFARAWLDGHEVEKEKRYTVVMKETKQPLYYNAGDKKLFFSLGGLATNFTQKQLEATGFSEVFNSPLFEVVEVEE